MSNENVPSRPEPIALSEFLRRWGAVLGPFLGIAATAWAAHHIWHAFDPVVMVLLWLPAGITQLFFSYRREFQPDRLPSMLGEDSEELAKLKRKKILLKCVGYGGVGFCVLFLLLTRLLKSAHPGQTGHQIPDIFWIWMALPIVASCVCVFWSEALEAYIKQRTLPAAKPARSSRGRRSPMVISGRAFQGNGFQSDHWGERGSNSHVQTETDL